MLLFACVCLRACVFDCLCVCVLVCWFACVFVCSCALLLVNVVVRMCMYSRVCLYV